MPNSLAADREPRPTIDPRAPQADGAFLKGTKVKDGLLKRLGAERVTPKIGR